MKKIILLALLFAALFTGCIPDAKTEKILTSIYISQMPLKRNYSYDEELDLTGLVVKARYSDGSEAVIDNWSSSPEPWAKLKSSGTIIVTITYNEKITNFIINVSKKSTIIADKYFWGIWVRMDNGKEYEVLESSVVQENKIYNITDSNSRKLTVSTLGTFTKESDRVMVNNNIPYFRKGGTNLEYSLNLVGFNSQTSRAVGIGKQGIKGRAESTKYTFVSNAESDSSGKITFTAPTTNDPQTVTIINGDTSLVIPGLTIVNSGDFMGTVALVGKNDYNLKITGKISDDQKENGCLYGNRAKSYNMIVSITNISKNKCSASGCKIESLDPNLILHSDSINLSGFTISTLAEGSTKTVSLTVEYDDLSEPYIDTGITITINNPLTNQEWTDYIPLRFFKKSIPITISTKSPEANRNAALNGFVIYPDGNNQFFAITNNSSKTVLVPTFGEGKEYLLVFSGATVTSQLSDSTEMYYTVEPNSSIPKPVITESYESILDYISFGGNNHSENTAYSVTEGFEAYLADGEIDYYSISADWE